ncbi:MAG: ComEC/Rec2 family competence protein [Candidatus Pacebacteria bacterium]|nr:ComEC/Rec2 family competence protein [Candidatus Paceibacterota bacterium]
MTLSQKAFWVFVLFIVGVLLQQIGARAVFVYIVVAGGILCACVFWAAEWGARALFFVPLIVIVLVGFWYAQWRERYLFDTQSKVAHSLNARVQGVIIASPRVSDKSTRVIVRQKEGGIVAAYTEPYRSLSYGDSITLMGDLTPLDEASSYLSLSGVGGIMPFATIVSHQSGQWSIARDLFAFRAYFSHALLRVLPRQEAALAAGLLLGKDSAGFSALFKDAMKNSGTTHLVALSGYNITIVVAVIWAFFGLIFKRRIASITVVCGVVLFVVMTGAESSVVRAALMGILSIGAYMWSRVYSFSQSVVVAAFCMVLYNPLIITHDIGCILSFLSLFGMGVIGPLCDQMVVGAHIAIRFVVHILSQTVGAQMAVFPVLASVFKTISVWSILSNMLVLPLVPFAMMFSFCAGCVRILLPFLGVFFGAIAFLPLRYMSAVIIFFGSEGSYSLSWSWVATVVYYMALIGGTFLLYRYLTKRGYEL